MDGEPETIKRVCCEAALTSRTRTSSLAIKQNCDLSEHERIQTAEKPFRLHPMCEICANEWRKNMGPQAGDLGESVGSKVDGKVEGRVIGKSKTKSKVEL